VQVAAEQFRVVEDLSTLSSEPWNVVTQGEPALRLEVLRSLVEQQTRPLPMKIFLLEDVHGIAAAGLCREIVQAADYSPLDGLMFGRLRKLCNSMHLSAKPYLSFHLPLGGAAALCVRAAPTQDQQRWLTALMDGIECYAVQRGLGTAFMRIEEHTSEHAVLRERGYLETAALSTTVLVIEWQDIDGYVAHLRRSSRSAAQSVRFERNRARKHGVIIRPVPTDEANVMALYRLARSHHLQKNGAEPAYTQEFFLRLAAALGEDLLIFEAQRNGSRTAMFGLVRSGELAWAAWLGFESIDRPADFTYFNLVYYALAEYAPTVGIRKLLYGNTAYDAKSRRGCHISPCTLFYRPHSQLMRSIVHPFFKIHRAWHRRKNA
jgi:predicted N-acyltransferase